MILVVSFLFQKEWLHTNQFWNRPNQFVKVLQALKYCLKTLSFGSRKVLFLFVPYLEIFVKDTSMTLFKLLSCLVGAIKIKRGRMFH